jgi:hypothetical protein
MNRAYLIVSVLITVAIRLGIVAWNEARRATPTHSPASATVFARSSAALEAPEWQIFSSPDGAFSVRFPGEPVHTSGAAEESGVRVVYDRYTVERTTLSGDIITYKVLVGQMPVSVPEGQSLAPYFDALWEAIPGELLERGPVTLNGYPGEEVIKRLESGYFVHIRMFLAGNRRFQVLFAGPPGAPAPAEPSVEFLDSFELEPPARP